MITGRRTLTIISVRGLSCGLELVDFGVDEEASSDMVVFSKKRARGERALRDVDCERSYAE
jgi:hypothetical protein